MARIIYDMDAAWRFRRAEDVPADPSLVTWPWKSTCKAGDPIREARPDAMDSDWETVDLPHDALLSRPFAPEGNAYHGSHKPVDVWYRKSFVLEEELRGRQIFLEFEGIAIYADVYVNGFNVAASHSAYNEIAVDISDYVNFGTAQPNCLAVFCDGHQADSWWYPGTGIYRHVHLYAKAPLHIAHNGIFAKPTLTPGTENDWTVPVEVTLENSLYTAQSGALRVELLDGDRVIAAQEAAVTVGPDQTAAVTVTLPVRDPHRWDVCDPYLYTVRAVLDGGEDEEKARIGFRTIALDAKTGFYLNGRRVVVKGVCCHQDHAGVGVALPDAIQYYRIRTLKEYGINGYRCSHNPPTKALLDACDELGMIVMDENRRFEEMPEAVRGLETLIKRDRNRPSVIFWSVFNEEPSQNSARGARIYRRLKEVVRRLDDSRPITGAINGSMEGAGLEMDITGLNYGIDQTERFHEPHPDQPVIGSENDSAVATRGCYRTDATTHVLADRDEEVVPWGQTVRKTWDFMLKHEWFAGLYIWTGFDYRGEPTPYPSLPSTASQFGILDTCGFPKNAAYYAKACFVSEPMIHLLPHWNWQAGDVVRVSAPTNCEEAELYLNGKSLGRKAGDCIATPEWQVPFAPGTLTVIGYRGGKEAARDEVRTAGAPYAIRATADRTALDNTGKDATVVNLAVVDRDGIVLPDAADLLRFTPGDGLVFLGAGNGDPNATVDDTRPEHAVFHGLAQAVVSVSRGATAASLTVTAEGLAPATVVFTVEDAPAPLAPRAGSRTAIGGFRMSGITDEKPDPLRHFDGADVNSLMAIVFDDHHQSDFHNGWRLYRSVFRLPAGHGHFSLLFPNTMANDLEVYLDGKTLYESHVYRDGHEPLLCPFDAAGDTDADLRILIRMQDAPWGGIREGVILVCD